NEHIRYWAALGLRSQRRENLHPHQSIIIKAMQDAYPPVQITASAIAYDVFKDKKAEENLKKYSLHENRDLSLLALNYLLYVEDKSPFIETVEKIYEKEGLDYDISAASKDFLGSLGLVPNNFEYR